MRTRLLPGSNYGSILMKKRMQEAGMTLTIDFSPQIEARLLDLARARGTDPSTVVKSLVEENLPDKPLMLTPENDPTLAYLKSRLAEAPTDPEAIREAEEDLLEFKRNMNIPRKEAGARLHYPEAE